jgi:hypothetical protein
MRNKNQSVSSGYDDSAPLSEWGTDPTITQTGYKSEAMGFRFACRVQIGLQYH